MTIEAEIKARRRKWLTEYIATMGSQRDPRILAGAEAVTEVWEKHRPAVCVSFHVGRFLDFFRVARYLPMEILAFVDGPIQHYGAKAKWLVPSNVQMCSTISISEFKQLKRGTAMMFVMADIVVPQQDSHFVEAFGHIASYTTAWSELAVKLRSQAMMVVTPPRAHQPFFAQHLPIESDPCEPVERAFEMLEGYLESADDWENSPLHRHRASELKLRPPQTGDELLRSVGSLLAFDAAILGYLKSL